MARPRKSHKQLPQYCVDCIRGDSCGCEVTQQYRFLRTPDHRVTVLRLRPTVHVRTIQVASCGYGCGQPAPRDEPTAQVLGVTQPDADPCPSMRPKSACGFGELELS